MYRSDKPVDVMPYAGLFTAIPLLDGLNIVHMQFTPAGTRLGVVASMLALIIIGVYIFTIRIGRDKTTSIVSMLCTRISRWLNTAYAVVVMIVMIFMYLIPVVYGTIVRIF